jgi:hypothetical protein
VCEQVLRAGVVVVVMLGVKDGRQSDGVRGGWRVYWAARSLYKYNNNNKAVWSMREERASFFFTLLNREQARRRTRHDTTVLEVEREGFSRLGSHKWVVAAHGRIPPRSFPATVVARQTTIPRFTLHRAYTAGPTLSAMFLIGITAVLEPRPSHWQRHVLYRS